MTKFKLTWTMEVNDDELLEMVNEYQETELENLEGVTLEQMVEAMDAANYIGDDIDYNLNTDEIVVELLPNEEV